MIAATRTTKGSGTVTLFCMRITSVTRAISAVGMSTIDRLPRTMTAPVIAPIAAAVTPSTNAAMAGRWP